MQTNSKVVDIRRMFHIVHHFLVRLFAEPAFAGGRALLFWGALHGKSQGVKSTYNAVRHYVYT